MSLNSISVCYVIIAFYDCVLINAYFTAQFMKNGVFQNCFLKNEKKSLYVIYLLNSHGKFFNSDKKKWLKNLHMEKIYKQKCIIYKYL